MLELGVFALPDLKAIPEEPLNLHPPPGVNWKAFGRFARPFEAQEKSLRDYYGKDLPGIGVRVEYREDAVKPRPALVTIDPHAYVRTFKAADEWGKKLEASQLKDDPFPVVIEAILRTFQRFVRKAPL